MTDDGPSIVAFYEGSAPDDRGRLLDDILRFDDDRLEYVHDFIQWLFRRPSEVAPIRRRRFSMTLRSFRFWKDACAP